MSEIDSDLLAEFKKVTEQAADYRKRSFGAESGQKHFDENGRSYFYLLSNHLMLIHHMVERHPELKEEYDKWRLVYPTFTSD